MNKKEINFFEAHIEKIVLALCGLISFGIIVTNVLISPNQVELNNSTFVPGEIDQYISQQKETLVDILNDQAQTKEAPTSKMDTFIRQLRQPFDVSHPIIAFVPTIASEDIEKEYIPPQIPPLENPAAGHLRAVAYFPAVPLDRGMTYSSVEKDLNDLDLVTIQATLNIPEIYGRYKAHFYGDKLLNEQWADPCLAKPIFAEIQLQRQELLDENRWSDWTVVPTTQINNYAYLLKGLTDMSSMPPGGMNVKTIQLNRPEVQHAILQPPVYSIASNDQEWYPPILHLQYEEIKQQIKAEERRAKMLMRQEEKASQRDQNRRQRPGRSTTTPGQDFSDEDDMDFGIYDMSTSRSGQRDRQPRRRREDMSDATTRLEQEKPTLEDVSEDFEMMLLKPDTDLAQLDEPITVWAFDDTVGPGKTYRYRMRIGTLNVLAGTDKLADGYEDMKDQPVLWSAFTDVPSSVSIPAMTYVFPINIQESTKNITVQVANYVLGYWYSDDFLVRPGETIGSIREVKKDLLSEQDDMTSTPTTGQIQDVAFPELIDYTTDKVVVDAVLVNEWVSIGKTLTPRTHYDMLYSIKGLQFERIPIKREFWPQELQKQFRNIKELERRPREPFRAFGSFSDGGTRDRMSPFPDPFEDEFDF